MSNEVQFWTLCKRRQLARLSSFVQPAYFNLDGIVENSTRMRNAERMVLRAAVYCCKWVLLRSIKDPSTKVLAYEVNAVRTEPDNDWKRNEAIPITKEYLDLFYLQ